MGQWLTLHVVRAAGERQRMGHHPSRVSTALGDNDIFFFFWKKSQLGIQILGFRNAEFYLSFPLCIMG